MKMNEALKNKSSNKKYTLAAFIIFCILAGYIYMTVTWTPVDSKSQKESETIIRQAVAERLKKDPNNLTDNDFLQVRYFSIENKTLSDLRLFKKFTNMRRLDLVSIRCRKAAISKWKQILEKLGIINLSERRFLDISPLGGLSTITELDMLGSQVKNIKPLASLTNLRALGLGSTKVADLEPIKNLKKLELLDLLETQVSDLRPIKGLTNLYLLILEHTQVSDIEPIKDLTNLKTLYLGGTKISNFDPVRHLINLKELRLNDTAISNLESLKGLKNLETLNISRCPNITDREVEDLQKALPNLKIER
jgi:Leucine-rich repeat (LRR) protein